MPLNRRALVVALGVTLGACAATASAQTPRLPSSYDMADVGPVPVAGACSCIASPFAVGFRPDPRYPSGPGARADGTPAAPDAAEGADPRIRNDRASSLQRRAEEGMAGDPTASFSVALDLTLGDAVAGGTARTDEETVRWLRLAASQGNSNTFTLLGYHYATGRGVRQDDAAAAYWFQRGAATGDDVSMIALGLLHAAGRGVPQDWAAAAALWARAQGRNSLASRFAGDAYACGLGVDPNPARAVELYKAGAAQGDWTSSTHLAHMYAKGCAEGSDEAAVKAYEEAAQQGHPEAQVELSELLRQGRGGHPNPYAAYTWARLAELRLPAGALKTRASAAVAAAVRQMLPEALPKQEALVQSLIAAGSRPTR